MSNATLNAVRQNSLAHLDFLSIEHVLPSIGIVGSNSSSTLDLLGTVKLFYIPSASLHIHTDNVRAVLFLHVLANSGFLLYLS